MQIVWNSPINNIVYLLRSDCMESVNKYHFDNAKATIRATIGGNFILSILFTLTNLTGGNFLANPFFQISFITALGILILNKLYNWENATINISVICCYLLVYLIEFLIHGIPAPVTIVSRGFSKGILLDMVLLVVPLLYVGMRIMLVFPILHTHLRSRKLKQTIPRASNIKNNS